MAVHKVQDPSKHLGPFKKRATTQKSPLGRSRSASEPDFDDKDVRKQKLEEQSGSFTSAAKEMQKQEGTPLIKSEEKATPSPVRIPASGASWGSGVAESLIGKHLRLDLPNEDEKKDFVLIHYEAKYERHCIVSTDTNGKMEINPIETLIDLREILPRDIEWIDEDKPNCGGSSASVVKDLQKPEGTSLTKSEEKATPSPNHIPAPGSSWDSGVAESFIGKHLRLEMPWETEYKDFVITEYCAKDEMHRIVSTDKNRKMEINPFSTLIDFREVHTKTPTAVPASDSSLGGGKPESLIGKHVYIRLPGEKEMGEFIIAEFNAEQEMHRIKFADPNEMELDELLSWITLENVPPKDIKWNDEDKPDFDAYLNLLIKEKQRRDAIAEKSISEVSPESLIGEWVKIRLPDEVEYIPFHIIAYNAEEETHHLLAKFTPKEYNNPCDWIDIRHFPAEDIIWPEEQPRLPEHPRLSEQPRLPKHPRLPVHKSKKDIPLWQKVLVREARKAQEEKQLREVYKQLQQILLLCYNLGRMAEQYLQ